MTKANKRVNYSTHKLAPISRASTSAIGRKQTFSVKLNTNLKLINSKQGDRSGTNDGRHGLGNGSDRSVGSDSSCVGNSSADQIPLFRQKMNRVVLVLGVRYWPRADKPSVNTG